MPSPIITHQLQTECGRREAVSRRKAGGPFKRNQRCDGRIRRSRFAARRSLVAASLPLASAGPLRCARLSALSRDCDTRWCAMIGEVMA